MIAKAIASAFLLPFIVGLNPFESKFLSLLCIIFTALR